MASARKPIPSDSPSAITPRITGSRKTRWRAIGESPGLDPGGIAPWGLRTATPRSDGPRITPPRGTPCPPIAAATALPAAGAAGLLEPALEALDAAAGVHQLLLARVERVAVRADLDVQLSLRGARDERVPARAVHVREDVLGMDVGLHPPARIAEAVSSATLPPETTATAVSPGSSLTFPDKRAAVVAAPAGSHAIFARP